MTRSPQRRRISASPARSFGVLATGTFVTLGIPDGMIGTAWPAVRRAFGAPLGDLGVILVVGTLGGLASSSVGGVLMARVGVRGTIMIGAAAGAAGSVGLLVSPGLWAFVVSGTGIGIAAGLFDSAVNTSVAMAGRSRLLNFLHGCYGVGSSLGPLLVTAALLASSWRTAYGALAVVEVVLVGSWYFAGRGSSPVQPGARPAAGPGGPGAPVAIVAPLASKLRVGIVVALGLLVFMVYVGFEAGAGQWEPSFDRGPLHLSAGATGLATAGYWAALTVARFALAMPRRPLPPAPVARWGSAVALAAAALVWWRPSPVAALVGLVVIGGALSGVFPALVSLTPARVGDQLAHHVISWQVGAAGIGGSVISAIFGGIFQRFGLGEFGLSIFVVAVLVMFGVLALERSSLRPS